MKCRIISIVLLVVLLFVVTPSGTAQSLIKFTILDSNLTTSQSATFDFEVENIAGSMVSLVGASFGIIQPSLGTFTLSELTSGLSSATPLVLAPGETITGDFGTLTFEEGTSEAAIQNLILIVIAFQPTFTFKPAFVPASVTLKQAVARISGATTYEITGGAVPAVDLTLSGDSSSVEITDADGEYSFEGLQEGLNYTVTPTKVNDIGDFSISCFDAALIAQHSIGAITLSPTQQIVADTDEDGNIFVFDAALACRFSIGLPPFDQNDHAGEWRFEPPDRSFTPLEADQIAQDFTAILLGDVDGSWTPVNGGASALAKGGANRLGFAQEVEWSEHGTEMTTSLHFDGSLAALSFDLELAYDAEALGYLEPIRVPEGWEVFVNSRDAGHLRLGMFSTQSLAKASELVRIQWEVLQEGAETEVMLEHALVNDEPQATTSLTTQLNPIPTEFTLRQNYPNPFNPETTIRYELPEPGEVRLLIYNLRGQLVRVLVDASKKAGFHSVMWDGKDALGRRVGSAVYLYRISAGEFTEVKKLTLLR